MGSAVLNSGTVKHAVAVRDMGLQMAAMPAVRQPADILPWLPCTLALEVKIVGFTVGSLLRLTPGALVETACHQSADLPLQVNGILMAWSEFEVVGDRLAARITDLV